MGLDFGLEYWNFSWRKGVLTGLRRVGEMMLGLSKLSTSPDNAAYDMTVHAARHYNEVGLNIQVTWWCILWRVYAEPKHSP
jgi:hypothetical protein